MKSSLNIGERIIGDKNPCYIIAEMSANHAGDLNKALEIVHAARDAGADCIKTQAYTPDTITIDCDNKHFKIEEGTWKGETLYSLYQKAYTPWEWIEKIKNEADKIGIDFLCTPFDKTSVDFLEKLNVKFYKIASFELIDIPLISYVASKGKPIIVSTGMGNLGDIEDAIKTIENHKNKDICILKCSSSYPARYEDMNIKTIQNLKDTFGYPVGLSDHSMGAISAIVAVANGANVIEKHFCLSRKFENPDSSFSMEPEEFKEMVLNIRNAEKAIGKVSYNVSDTEKKSVNFKKSIFVVKDIIKGEELTEENIKVIRPGYGLKPKHYFEVLNKKATKDIKRGTPFNWNMCE